MSVGEMHLDSEGGVVFRWVPRAVLAVDSLSCRPYKMWRHGGQECLSNPGWQCRWGMHTTKPKGELLGHTRGTRFSALARRWQCLITQQSSWSPEPPWLDGTTTG